MEYLAILGALLTYRVITDLWDCFGFGCDDICCWLGEVAEKCKERRMARGQQLHQSAK
jgi:hypothetical protein